MIKSIFFFCIVLSMIITHVFSDISDADLNKIRLIVKEEIAESEKRLKEEIDKSERQMKQYVDTKFEAVDTKFESIDKRMTLFAGFLSGLMLLIVVTVGNPQIIIALRQKNEKEQDKKIEDLYREIDALKQQRIVNP